MSLQRWILLALGSWLSAYPIAGFAVAFLRALHSFSVNFLENETSTAMLTACFLGVMYAWRTVIGLGFPIRDVYVQSYENLYPQIKVVAAGLFLSLIFVNLFKTRRIMPSGS